MSSKKNATDPYKAAGVDVEKGDHLVDWLVASKPPTQTRLGSAVAGIGGFACLFRPDFKEMKNPLLVASTDGVGTKVLLGMETGKLQGLGVDLVAMCVNDLFTLGARPMFFLDYYATGALDEHQFKAVLSGIQQGCRQSGAALLGGETAEMPGLYAKGHFDLAGFVVGAVDQSRMLGPENVRAGDRLYAIESSGFHSNGYSLIRKWLGAMTEQQKSEEIERIMTPTRIYHEIPDLLEELGTGAFHAVANITGGGISGNLPRVIPDGLDCHVTFSALPTPAWMRGFCSANGSNTRDLEGIFNLGCGMIAVVARDSRNLFESACRAKDLPVREIGEVRSAGSASPSQVVFND